MRQRLTEKDLTQDLVKHFFDYKDGWLYWKNSDYSTNIIGQRAGYIRKNKNLSDHRYVIKLKTGCFYGSRIIYFYHYGTFPDFIDHIDRNTLNNRIENLRPTTKSQNSKNKKSGYNSSSKYLGVHLYKPYSIQTLADGTVKRYEYPPQWIARIKSDGKSITLGYFSIKDEDEAALAYNKAAVKYHKEFANLNIIQPENVL